MPTMATIPVLMADDATSVDYTALQGSSGDGVAAVWRNETVGTAAGHRPIVSMTSRWNGPRTARRVDASFAYPQIATDSTTGLTSVVNKVPVTLSAVIPANVPDAVVNEAIAQAINLFDSPLFVASFKTGYAPT